MTMDNHKTATMNTLDLPLEDADPEAHNIMTLVRSLCWYILTIYC
jgi:hypothetical protein